MDEDSEKMVALKQACADIILSTAKEAAARVLAAERKAFQLQRSLEVSKEESLAVLLRLKAVMESKIKEAEKVKLSQARKIEYLEVQLCEAKDIIGSLRSEMKKVNPRLEIRRNQPTAVLSKENGEATCMLNSGLNKAANHEPTPRTLKNNEPDHYLSRCTQRNCVFEDTEKELSARSSKIDTEIINHQTAEKSSVPDSLATWNTISTLPLETNEIGLLGNSTRNGNALRFCKQYGRRKVLRKEVIHPIAEVSSITGKSISLESLSLELKEVGPLNDIRGKHNVHGVHGPSLKRRKRNYIVEPNVKNSTVNGKLINTKCRNVPPESKEVDQLNICRSHKILGGCGGNGRQRWRKHIKECSDENCAMRDSTFCLVNIPLKSKRVGQLGKLCGNGNKLRFWSRYGRPRMQRKHVIKSMRFGTSVTIANHESSYDNLKTDEPSCMNHMSMSSENTHTDTSEAPQETLNTCLENAETQNKERINLKELFDHQMSGLPTNKSIMTEEIVMRLCSTSSENHISSSNIVGSIKTGEDDNECKLLTGCTGSMLDEPTADKDVKQDTCSEKTVESRLTTLNREIVEDLLTSEPTENNEIDHVMENIKPGDGEVDRTAQPAEAASSRTTSCVIKYTYRKKRKRVCLDSKHETISLEENSARKVPKENTLVDAQNSDFVEDSSSRDSRRLAQVARQLISLSEKRWW